MFGVSQIGPEKLTCSFCCRKKPQTHAIIVIMIFPACKQTSPIHHHSITHLPQHFRLGYSRQKLLCVITAKKKHHVAGYAIQRKHCCLHMLGAHKPSSFVDGWQSFHMISSLWVFDTWSFDTFDTLWSTLESSGCSKKRKRYSFVILFSDYFFTMCM